MAGVHHPQVGEAVMALTLNLAVLPVVASLVAGTGALATYATAPNAPRDMAPAHMSAAAPQTAAVAPDAARPSPAPQAARPCDVQTWPYIDASCTRKSADERKVRVVTAPRAGDMPEAAPGTPVARLHIPAPQNPNVTPVATPPGMISSDTVLRSPEIVVPPRKMSKREKRAEQRRESRERSFDAQLYQVPGEAYDRRARSVTVVRPLRLEAFR
jgi:hypothetical protein